MGLPFRIERNRPLSHHTEIGEKGEEGEKTERKKGKKKGFESVPFSTKQFLSRPLFSERRTVSLSLSSKKTKRVDPLSVSRFAYP